MKEVGKWCDRIETTSVPAQEEHVILFVLSVLEQAKSTITLQHVAYAI